MTFELLKVCRQANPAWIELRVMYVSSTVTDRHARWVIINQNYCIKESNYLFFFISLFRFVFYFFPSIFFISVYFVLLSLVSFHFGSISLISFRFVSFRFRWFRFVSFRFYFVSHFIGTPQTTMCFDFYCRNSLLSSFWIILYCQILITNIQNNT